MPVQRFRYWLPASVLLPAGIAEATTVEGGLAGDIGAVLVLLGVVAVLLGARNWRILRHKPPLALRCRPGAADGVAAAPRGPGTACRK